MNRSDVKVVAVRTGTVLIEDVGISVPHGVAVAIPAEKALASKDLYRLLSQRILFQIHPGAIHKGGQLPELPRPRMEPPPAALVSSPDSRETHLEAEVQVLRDALEQREQVLFATMAASQDRTSDLEEKLDRVLSLLVRQPVGAPGPIVKSPSAVPEVSMDAPMFIPSEIKPRDVESHVSIAAAESHDSGVDDAKTALRRIRKGQ